MSSSRIKWGDVDDHEFDSTASTVQQRSSTTHNNNDIKPGTATESFDKASGIKTVVEYTTNAEGKTVRVTRRIKSQTKSIQINKNVLLRRKWRKFGDASNAGTGIEMNVTIPSNELITLDLSTAKSRNHNDEKDESALDKLKGGSSIVVCSYCKGMQYIG